MADKYVTGHRPPETLQQLVSRLNSSAFFLKDHEPKLPKRRKRRGDKITDAASKLGEEQLGLLLRLLRGEAVRIQVNDEPYAAWRVEGGWVLQGLAQHSVRRTVYVDPPSCSCPQNKMHGRYCKHMKAVEAMR